MQAVVDSGVVFISKMLILKILQENVDNILCFEIWAGKKMTLFDRRGVNVYRFNSEKKKYSQVYGCSNRSG
jgi:pimeloyl-CoA synthetase